MKNKLRLLSVVFLMIGASVFADDVQIDSNGNVKTGVASSGNLEVTGASAEKAIVGQSSGTGGSGVYGINTTSGNYGYLGWDTYGVYGYNPSGWAGYFQGNARVTGNLTVDGSITGTLSETDPQVGTLTNLKWCTSNGTVINCTSDAPSVSETDPQVGSNTSDYIPKWDGTALVSGTIFDNGSIGIGTSAPQRKLHIVDNNPRILIEAISSNSEVNFKSSGDTAAEIWALYKDAATDDLRFYQNGNKVTLQSGTGNIGIGTTNPAQKLSVAGTIESTSGGVKFPDGTTQTTASTSNSWYQILPATERFVLVMGGAAVLDKETGLVWARSPSAEINDWYFAIGSCIGSNIGDRKGWHLPTIEQLASLVDMSVSGSPKLPSGHPFLNVGSSRYWSATTRDTVKVYVVWFNDGSTGNVAPKDSILNYWCVRGGQSPAAY